MRFAVVGGSVRNVNEIYIYINSYICVCVYICTKEKGVEKEGCLNLR